GTSGSVSGCGRIKFPRYSMKPRTCASGASSPVRFHRNFHAAPRFFKSSANNTARTITITTAIIALRPSLFKVMGCLMPPIIAALIRFHRSRRANVRQSLLPSEPVPCSPSLCCRDKALPCPDGARECGHHLPSQQNSLHNQCFYFQLFTFHSNSC